MSMITLNVNGKARNLDIPDDMPLLWTLRDVLSMTGTKYLAAYTMVAPNYAALIESYAKAQAVAKAR